ncbi:MAG: RNA 2',3'-cyclic phosphodiesterase [Terriglobia bacterium]
MMAKPDEIRTFVCLELPRSVKELLSGVQDDLKGVGAKVSWVKPANIHLTLKFLGNLSQSRLAEVCVVVEEAGRAVSPFGFQVKGAGAFPPTGNPRVLWVGLAGVSAPLQDLQQRIDTGLFQRGFPRENKPFSPHLTIGRVQSGYQARALLEKISRLKVEGEMVNVHQVAVMKSDLRAGGALYTPIQKFPLLGDNKSEGTNLS